MNRHAPHPPAARPCRLRTSRAPCQPSPSTTPLTCCCPGRRSARSWRGWLRALQGSRAAARAGSCSHNAGRTTCCTAGAVRMPLLGLGTYKVESAEAVKTALECECGGAGSLAAGHTGLAGCATAAARAVHTVPCPCCCRRRVPPHQLCRQLRQREAGGGGPRRLHRAGAAAAAVA